MSSAIKLHGAPEGKPEIIFRKPTADDAIAITRLARALAEYEGVSCRVTSADIGMLLAQPDFYYLRVAEAEGRVVAFIFAYPGYDLSSATHGYHLADLFVAEPYRRMGIAQRLLGDAQSFATKQGGHWVSFTVLEHNGIAKEFYAHAGAQRMPVEFQAIGLKNP